jgi:hemerythrin
MPMESFHWDKVYETGLTEVDEQHHELVDLINRFGTSLAENRGGTGGDVEAVFAELADYAIYHFREEEGLMDRAGVDDRFARHHLREHANFLREVAQHQSSRTINDPSAGPRLLSFLIAWLAHHILGTDQALARQVAAIRAGDAPARAYLAEERVREAATDPLLGALNVLFRLVSERNAELTELNRTLEAKVEGRTAELRRLAAELAAANQHLEAIAHTDALTGLPNRRHAMAMLGRLWAESTKLQLPLSCMLLDADGFKRINDTFGHDAGDEVLRVLARHLRHGLRNDDFVGRLGGDEFLVLCPRTALAGAMALAETLRRDTAALCVPAGGGEWTGSISIGVAERRSAMSAIEDLVKAADEGVYEAKRQGRNRVATLQEG